MSVFLPLTSGVRIVVVVGVGVGFIVHRLNPFPH
jgi:hypothetical protein